MNLQSRRWSGYVRSLFGKQSMRKTSKQSIRLEVEELQERIVPSTFSPNPNAADGAANSLRADIRAANADATANATEVFDLSAGAVYSLTKAAPSTGHDVSGLTGNLVIHNAGSGIKTYVFVGLGSGSTIEQTALDRVFEIIGSNAVVEFKNVTISGGRAIDDGVARVLPGTTEALGGGILNEGATLELFDSTVTENFASGSTGATSSNSSPSSKTGGTPDIASVKHVGFGQDAFGGGIYSTAGKIIINGSNIEANKARGGAGGTGSAGASVTENGTGLAGAGRNGVAGGNAGGGAIYILSGNLTVENGSIVSGDAATAGAGGAGGSGGGDQRTLGIGGLGGNGGQGGNVTGGGIAVVAGEVTIAGASQVSGNFANAGAGGSGGAGGNATKLEGNGGDGGDGGASGSSFGGGLYIGTGTLTITQGSGVSGNSALGGSGGKGGNGGFGAAVPSTSSTNAIRADRAVPDRTAMPFGNGGIGVYGGQASGGGVYMASGSLIVEGGASITKNVARGGDGGAGGSGGSGYSFGGDGAPGGVGGNAHGGGISIAAGTLLVEQGSAIGNNSAQAGLGGTGGAGGDAGTFSSGVAGYGGAGGNSGTAFGGGIYSSGSSVFIELSSVADNVATGQVSAAMGGAGGSASGNSGLAGAGGAGGAGGIAIGGGIATAGGSLTISEHSLIQGNKAIGGKGGSGGVAGQAYASASSGSMGVAGSAIGGGIYAPSGSVVLQSVQVQSNQAGGSIAEGGGIYLGEGKLTVALSGISDNRVLGSATGASISLQEAGNPHATGGGGIYVWTGTMSLTIQSSSITGNSASTALTQSANGEVGNAFGGGLFTSAAESSITDSTIAFNTVKTAQGDSLGGGIFFASVDTDVISNSTIADNASGGYGGGIFNEGSLSLTSTLVSDNSSSSANGPDLSDFGTTSAKYSIIENVNGNSIDNGVNNDQVGISESSINLASTLTTASNGTQYLSLNAPSDAIGSGSNANHLATDQIGDERQTAGATDVGAVQYSLNPVPISLLAYSTGDGAVELVNSTTGQVYQDFQPFGTSYTGTVSAALADVNGDGIPDLIVAAHGTDAGQVLIYDGAAALVTGVVLNNSLTWSNGTASTLPNGETSALLGAITAFANYRGGLTVAAGDLQASGGDADVIVGTVAGSLARVAAFSSVNGKWVQLGNTITPFGSRFTGGVTLASASIQSQLPADIIVGSASQMSKLAAFGYSGTAFQQIGSTIAPFGSVSSGLQVAAVDPYDSGVFDIAAATLQGGAVEVEIVNAETLTSNGPFVSKYAISKKLTGFELGVIDPNESGNELLLLASVPGTGAALELNPLTGEEVGTLELPVVTSGILLATS